MKPQLLILVTLLLIAGCKRFDTQPELKDPIYGDLIHKMEDQARDVEAIKRDLDALKKQFALSDPQNGEMKTTRKSVFDEMEKLDRALQKLKFLELQAERRKEFARESYRIAFEKNQEWPDPEEFRLYKINKSLVDIPKNYDETHKKRIAERAPAAPKKQEPKKPAE